MLFVYAIVGTTRYGWDSSRTFLAAALAVALLAAFLTRQATAPYTAAAAPHLLGAQRHRGKPRPAPGDRRPFGFQVIVTLYMQRVPGYGAAASGLGNYGVKSFLITARWPADLGAGLGRLADRQDAAERSLCHAASAPCLPWSGAS